MTLRSLVIPPGGAGGGLTNINISAGAASANLSNLVFSNSNNVSFGLNGSTITASAAAAGGANINISAGSTSNNMSAVTFADSNGISFGLNGSVVTGTVATNYQSQGAYLTTAMAANRGSDFVQATAAFAGTNASGTIASNGISVSVAAPGVANYSVGVSTGGNTSGNTGVTGTRIVFAGTNGITLSQATDANGATISVSGYAPISSYEPYPFLLGSSSSAGGAAGGSSDNIRVVYFSVPYPVSAGIMNLMVSANFTTVGTSSGRQTAGIAAAIYTRNVSTLSSIASTSFSWQVTGNNSTYSINQVTATSYTGYAATAQTSSAGVNISSGYTGIKHIGFPINSLLTPGAYWLALIGTNSTNSVNVGMNFSYMGMQLLTVQNVGAPIGSGTGNYSTSFQPDGQWMPGHGVWTSAGSVTMVPVSMDFASISLTAGAIIPFMKFWRT